MSDKRTIADQLDRFGGSIPDAARKHESIVYYMRMDRLVKIGMSRNIAVPVGEGDDGTG